jgi:hypothetical protein
MSLYLIAAILGAGFVAIWMRRIARTYGTNAGTHVITCPAAEQSVAVELGAWHAARTAAFGTPELRVDNCSLWPERRNCDQACLLEIEAEPSRSRVEAILEDWSLGKKCVCCQSLLTAMRPGHHPPCLMSPEGRIYEWHEVPAQTLPQVLNTWGPVCWNCLMAETHTW